MNEKQKQTNNNNNNKPLNDARWKSGSTQRNEDQRNGSHTICEMAKCHLILDCEHFEVHAINPKATIK